MAAQDSKERDVVVITGCSRGLGLEFVKQYAAAHEDSLIFACYRPSKHSDALLALASEHNKRVVCVEMDVTDESSIVAACDTIKARVSHVNLLINNAAIVAPNHPEKALDSSVETMMKVYQTNTVAPYLMIKHLHQLLAAVSGKVINVSSDFASMALTAKDDFGTAISYRCSKVALNMLTVVMSIECAPVVFVALHPGWVKTDMGSDRAPLTVDVSVAGMLTVIAQSTRAHNGRFLDYQGSELPW